ncbi:glycoprotein endopeptidase, putative [Theileria equi strain WA]|uniref:N(6)-L-threonylcarbamoyladenine synthase n=1 Tax=Theileria equi strain WA TaxID=1537102 RepID=L0B1Z0_THEEQ|nr:glycoprotein endopeptidase, putative [Theileria equi strain WA]AFZ81149.1 glycoprotein endopeptidase, putative [Theileria equi strain WA]|eukprot:XP_004830815.1 glycoprotein endopeptidase, putative [Theileria equi strain WA]
MHEYSDEYLSKFYTIGIEGSANKLGIGIIRGDGVILSNLRRTYSAPDGEGFLPRHIAKHHRDNVASLVNEALNSAGIELSQISLICYTKGPGLGSGLHVGALTAKTLHFLTGAPIVGVNHCVAHVEMGRFLSGYKRPCILYVSGGNTQILFFDKVRRVYAVLGETLDIAIGNVLDRLARLLNLPNKPAPGLSIELSARKSSGNLIPLPFVVKGMDCSLSGLLTKAEQLIEQFKLDSSSSDDFSKDFETFSNDLCFSVQEHTFAMLLEMVERAMAFTESNELLLVGGVGCNLRLQEMAEQMANDRGAKLFPMDERYCIDNGAMIGYTGMVDYLYGSRSDAVLTPENVTFSQRYRTDQAPVLWI